MSIHEPIHRVAVTFPVLRPDDLDAEGAIGVFHRWIREGCGLEGLLIDVADYRHVPDGPGVMLIGLEWDRSIEFTTGQAAVRSVNKQPPADDHQSQVAAVTRDALMLAAGLAEPTALADAALVDTRTCIITLLDRLAFTDDDGSAAAVTPTILDALAPLEPTGVTRRTEDPRGPLTVEVTLGLEGTPETLARQLDAAVATSSRGAS